MDESGSDTSSGTRGPLPQQELSWLFDRDDFKRLVAEDEVNLCCVVVTSTLCRHSGVRTLRYPKVKPAAGPGAPLSGDDEEDGEDVDGDGEDDEGSDFDEGSADGRSTGGPKRSRFLADVKARMIDSGKNLSQRRHIRFFQICACVEEEAEVERLIARDPTYAMYGRRPNEFELRELRRTAHKELVELIRDLEVRSTPCMLFYLKGQPVRYSMVLDAASGNRADAPAAKDVIVATGSNWVKWRRLLQNATVVRNELLKEYDAVVREAAKQEQKRLRKLQRAEERRLRELEGDEEDDEENDDNDDDDE